MISLRLWLVSLLLALPFYAYSLNHRPNQPVEDVFQRRDLDDVRNDLEKRQLTDPAVAASISSVIASVSDVIKSITENPDAFTASISEIEASLSSVILSVSSQLFPAVTTPAETSATSTSADSSTSSADGSVTSPAFTPSATPGQVITDGTRTGTVGDDGTTRFCSASSYLCPASVSYGCCKDGFRCGLTACTPSAGATTPTFGSFTATGGDATSTPDATYSFDPNTSKGGSPTTAAPAPNNSGSGSSGLSGGAIGGIVGGVIGGIAIVAAGVVWFCLSKRKSKPTGGALPPPDGPKPGPTEQYTGGPIPPQPQMAQYGQNGAAMDPRYQSPPPQPQGPGGFYQPYPQQQFAGQQAQPPYGQNVSELGGAAMPYGQKGVDQPQGIQEAPANPVSSNTQPPAPQGGDQGAAPGYNGYKGPTGPVYELGN
ncbi:hypothetical protein H072_2105 [Dactylellina haptotyla CBS 200.50]|uniref:Uncharacterized protein n=1 Tax=Dactylellina haptotyla (strain CBS 200.50) TaxID=1284197 RepID=S8C8D4_DACHA|nr:hypothetical protein H072_2105 [Dactylellina haptotyla CBS 200.50]